MRCIFPVSLFIVLWFAGACRREENQEPLRFITRWEVKPSFKYDLCSFAGIMTGREFYTRYYPEMYAEWKKRLTPAAAFALKKIDEIIGPETPPGPRLCLIFSAMADNDDSLSAIFRSLDRHDALPRASSNSAHGHRLDLQQWQALKPHLRLFLEFAQKENFESYWRQNLFPAINRQAPYLYQELQAFDVIGDLERFLVDWNFPDTIRVHVVRLLQPHALRLSGQRYVTDGSYPIHVTVRSAYHELVHPYAERLVDSLLAAPFKRLEDDSFLQLTMARLNRNTGYKNFRPFFHEEVAVAAEAWVAERRRMISQITHTSSSERDPQRAIRRYLAEQDEGMHVLAAVIYSYLAEGMKDDGQSYADFLRRLFDGGRLAPGKIEERYNKFMNVQ